MGLNFLEQIIPTKILSFLRQRSISLVAIIATLILAVSVYMFKVRGKGGNNHLEGFTIAVEASPVQLADVENSVLTIGSLKANESVIIRPEVTGQIKEILFEEGVPIQKGKVLILLDDEMAKAELEDAKANFMLAKANYNRAKKLYTKSVNSAATYDEARVNFMKAQAQLDIKQASFNKTKIIAPFEGVIGLRQVSPGDYVQPGQDLVPLKDVTPIKIEFNLPEKYATQIKKGQLIEFSTEALPGKMIKGKVYAIAPKLDESGRSLCVRAEASNEDHLLYPGMFVKIRVILGKHFHSLLVPEEAIVPVGKDQFVYRIVDKKAQFTKVKLGLRKDGKVEILEGLKAEDIIVTAGQLKLQDKVAVSIQSESK